LRRFINSTLSDGIFYPRSTPIELSAVFQTEAESEDEGGG